PLGRVVLELEAANETIDVRLGVDVRQRIRRCAQESARWTGRACRRAPVHLVNYAPRRCRLRETCATVRETHARRDVEFRVGRHIDVCTRIETLIPVVWYDTHVVIVV